MASSPIVWTPDKRMLLQSAVADLSPEAFQAVVGRVFGPARRSGARSRTRHQSSRRRHAPRTARSSASTSRRMSSRRSTEQGDAAVAHNTNTKIFLKRAGRGRKKAVLQHSPFMPYGDCEFSITAAGVVDAVDG